MSFKNTLEDQNSRYSNEIDALRKQLEDLKIEFDESKLKISRQNEIISQLEECIANQENDLVSKASDTQETIRTYSKCKNENTILSEDLFKTRQIVSELNMQISGLKINLDEERLRIKTLKNEIFCNESAIKDLQSLVSQKSNVFNKLI